MAFVPITVEEYVKRHVKINRGDNPKEFLASLRACVKEALAGARCQCGAPIWSSDRL